MNYEQRLSKRFRRRSHDIGTQDCAPVVHGRPYVPSCLLGVLLFFFNIFPISSTLGNVLDNFLPALRRFASDTFEKP